MPYNIFVPSLTTIRRFLSSSPFLLIYLCIPLNVVRRSGDKHESKRATHHQQYFFKRYRSVDRLYVPQLRDSVHGDFSPLNSTVKYIFLHERHQRMLTLSVDASSMWLLGILTGWVTSLKFVQRLADVFSRVLLHHSLWPLASLLEAARGIQQHQHAGGTQTAGAHEEEGGVITSGDVTQVACTHTWGRHPSQLYEHLVNLSANITVCTFVNIGME